MRRTRVFFLLMLLLQLCLVVFDYFRSAIPQGSLHSFLVWFQTLCMLAGGLLIMRLTLDGGTFRLFARLYGGTWAIYLVIKKVLLPLCHLLPVSLAQPALTSLTGLTTAYLKYSQLLTPLPFLFFWLLQRVYGNLAVTALVKGVSDR